MASVIEEIDLTISDPPDLSFVFFDQWLAGRPHNSKETNSIPNEFISQCPMYVGSAEGERSFSDSKLASLYQAEKVTFSYCNSRMLVVINKL